MTDRILWRRLDLPGHEIALVENTGNGWRLCGTAIFAYGRRPCRLDYIVSCDASWATTGAAVTGTVGDDPVDLRVAVDYERRWHANGVECPVVEGCIDIDFGFSPSTNLLPIRRLRLPEGQSAAVRAAWLPFPALVFEVLPQVYRRDGEHTYRYESRGGAFARTLTVNVAGFVTSYPDLWESETST